MTVQSINITDYSDDSFGTIYSVDIVTNEGTYSGEIQLDYGYIGPHQLRDDISHICNDVYVTNDMYDLLNMLKEEIIMAS